MFHALFVSLPVNENHSVQIQATSGDVPSSIDHSFRGTGRSNGVRQRGEASGVTIADVC